MHFDVIILENLESGLITIHSSLLKSSILDIIPLVNHSKVKNNIKFMIKK